MQDMNPSDKRNQIKKLMAPGIWKDQTGKVHLSIPDLLHHVRLEDTPENREEAKAMFVEIMKKEMPNTPILLRKSPTDDGEDIR